MAQGIGASAELAEVVGCVCEAAVQDRHDLLVGGHVLGNEVTAATTPGAVAEDLGLSRGDGVEERHAHASTAGAGVQGSITLNDAALDPAGLLENCLRGVLEEFGACNQVGEESTPRPVAIKSGHCVAPVESLLAVAPQGLIFRPQL